MRRATPAAAAVATWARALPAARHSRRSAASTSRVRTARAAAAGGAVAARCGLRPTGCRGTARSGPTAARPAGARRAARAWRGAGGGSVWVQTGALAGIGTMEVKGGDATCNGGDYAGGGGALAVEYTTLEAGATLLDQLKAQGGAGINAGGAGTILVRGGSAPVYGQLIVDNAALTGRRRTVLPSLGKGTAQQGSGGAILVTGRAKIPAYFVGHWIEVRDGQTGVLEGTWRIAEILVDGVTVSLASNAGEAVTVDAGDSWQGVYQLDQYTVRGDVQVVSPDPIRVRADQ